MVEHRSLPQAQVLLIKSLIKKTWNTFYSDLNLFKCVLFWIKRLIIVLFYQHIQHLITPIIRGHLIFNVTYLRSIKKTLLHKSLLTLPLTMVVGRVIYDAYLAFGEERFAMWSAYVRQLEDCSTFLAHRAGEVEWHQHLVDSVVTAIHCQHNCLEPHRACWLVLLPFYKPSHCPCNTICSQLQNIFTPISYYKQTKVVILTKYVYNWVTERF